MITVERTDFVSVSVADMAQARQFSGETLDPGACHMAFFSDPTATP